MADGRPYSTWKQSPTGDVAAALEAWDSLLFKNFVLYLEF